MGLAYLLNVSCSISTPILLFLYFFSLNVHPKPYELKYVLMHWWGMTWCEEHLMGKKATPTANVCESRWWVRYGALNRCNRILISYEWLVALIKRSEISLNAKGWCICFFKSEVFPLRDGWLVCLDGSFTCISCGKVSDMLGC